MGQQRRAGHANKMWMTDGSPHDDVNLSVSGQAYSDWIANAYANQNN